MEEWIKKSDVLELLSLPTDILKEYICELKGVWVDEDWSADWLNGRWVSCDDGLPKYTDEYNVTVGVASEFGYFEKVTTLRFERIKGKEPRWVLPKNEIYNVIAWMPLPPTYKEEY